MRACISNDSSVQIIFSATSLSYACDRGTVSPAQNFRRRARLIFQSETQRVPYGRSRSEPSIYVHRRVCPLCQRRRWYTCALSISAPERTTRICSAKYYRDRAVGLRNFQYFFIATATGIPEDSICELAEGFFAFAGVLALLAIASGAVSARRLCAQRRESGREHGRRKLFNPELTKGTGVAPLPIRRRVRVVTSSAETPLAIARERIRSVHIHTWELGQPDPE